MSNHDQERGHGKDVQNRSDAASAQQPPGGDANIGRRRIAKLGLGAPVIMSLAAKPVFAGNCLSNMMSGNLSNPDRGHCSKGWSPGGWGQPGGMIGSYTTAGAWQKAGFVYGTFNANSCPTVQNPKETNYKCYVNGSTMSAMPSALNKDSIPTGTLLIKVVNYYTSTITRHLVTAYLNASLSENDPNFQYILTKQQVIDLANGANWPSRYGTLMSFLDSTWA